MPLTRAQFAVLQEAKRSKDGRIETSLRARKGGSRRRMLERLRDQLLVEGPPWQITGLGEDALADARGPWCPFCKKHHVGGDTCMGHYP